MKTHTQIYIYNQNGFLASETIEIFCEDFAKKSMFDLK